MKYKLKLNYTENELRELKELGKVYYSPMAAVAQVTTRVVETQPYELLWKKYRTLDSHKDFDFMADINNAVMGTAKFPEKKYVVHDEATDYYIYYNELLDNLRWSQLRIPEIKTKGDWLAINPAYEPMLERVEE